MSVLTRFWEQRSHPRSGDPVLVKMFGGIESHSGVTVNENTAIGWTALQSGIRWLSETIASLPLRVGQRLERGKEWMRGSRLWNLLHDEPNPEQTSYEWRDLSMVHCILWGNSYSQIVSNGAGEPIELWPIQPDRVQPFRDRNGLFWYRVYLPADEPGSVSGSTLFRPDEILHIRGFSRWGLIGEALPDIFRETIGLGLVTEQFAARFFGSGLHAGGILVHPAALSKPAQERLETSIRNQVGGISRAHRLLILEEGMQWHQMTVDPQKAQFLELRKFQVTEASRILRIPPHLLYDLERATFSNIESQGLEVLIYSLMSWITRWEQRLKKQLVSNKMKNKTFIKFGVEALLRGDIQTRYDAYTKGRQWGWLSANEVRDLEDMNPRAGGDTYLEPQNMVLVGPDGEIQRLNAPEPTEPTEEDEDEINGNGRRRLVQAIARAMED